VRAKLARLGLDRFVGACQPADVGNLEFRCRDVDGFRRRLRALGFVLRDRPDGSWDAREPARRYSLHCKHFPGWPDDKLQAHIDPWGVGGPWTILMHLLDYNGYRDVERIRTAMHEA